MRFFGGVLVALPLLALAALAPSCARADPLPRSDAAPRTEAPPRPAAPAPAAPAAPAKVHQVFEIDREGNKIGSTTIDIERQNDVTTVKTVTDISVKVMFIEAYRYEHSATETWKNGQLASFKSRTNDNGTKHTIEVGPGATPDKLSLTVDGARSEAPKTLAPASLWSKDIINHSDLFEVDKGKRLAIKVKDLGEESLTVRGAAHQTRHYRISAKAPGEFDRDVWFDGDLLVRLKLLGTDNSTIISDLR